MVSKRVEEVPLRATGVCTDAIPPLQITSQLTKLLIYHLTQPLAANGGRTGLESIYEEDLAIDCIDREVVDAVSIIRFGVIGRDIDPLPRSNGLCHLGFDGFEAVVE